MYNWEFHHQCRLEHSVFLCEPGRYEIGLASSEQFFIETTWKSKEQIKEIKEKV